MLLYNFGKTAHISNEYGARLKAPFPSSEEIYYEVLYFPYSSLSHDPVSPYHTLPYNRGLRCQEPVN